jgi:hypothetical protein
MSSIEIGTGRKDVLLNRLRRCLVFQSSLGFTDHIERTGDADDIIGSRRVDGV